MVGGSGWGSVLWNTVVGTDAAIASGFFDMFRVGQATGAVAGDLPCASCWDITKATAHDGARALGLAMGLEGLAESALAKGGEVGASTAVGNGPNCFVAGTLVDTPEGKRPIEQIHEGDTVCAYDEQEGVVEQKVARTIKRQADCVIELTLLDRSNQIETIVATPEHPFYIPDKGDFEPCGSLNPGTKLLARNGSWSRWLI